MQDYQYILAGGDDVIFVIIFIIIMIVRLVAKISKSQQGSSDDGDLGITIGGESKRSTDAQDELEAFLQNLAKGSKPRKRKPAVTTVPQRPKPIERRFQEVQSVRRTPRQAPAKPTPISQLPKARPIQTAIPVKMTPEAIAQHRADDAYKIKSRPTTATKDAYSITERSSKIAGKSSINDVRMDIGMDLINLTGIRKAIVLNEILGPPMAMKKQ